MDVGDLQWYCVRCWVEFEEGEEDSARGAESYGEDDGGEDEDGEGALRRLRRGAQGARRGWDSNSDDDSTYGTDDPSDASDAPGLHNGHAEPSHAAQSSAC
jgi:hypothetical protein